MKKTTTFRLQIQGYSQSMRLQRRLYGICLVRFLAFRVPYRPKNVFNHLVNHQNTQLNAETKNQASSRHNFGSSLQSHWG